MSALDQISAASDETFAGRVMMLMFKVGQQVASEDPGAPDHAARVAYAQRVMRGQEQPQLVAAHVISSNPTIGAAIDGDPPALGSNVPDADIEFALSSIWTARALAFAPAPAATG
jgi:hypothetical protein